ncbi:MULTISPECIES: glycosyltransferase [unclassified Curtobacterium]|uniref:glycosyltransferase family protein n=1 Tax=unclassified Curtobacterium TaxID=257496 RepID=UPI0011B46BAD|nr:MULTISPECIES: glycosyltransferase [unclassified Curtobacterium]
MALTRGPARVAAGVARRLLAGRDVSPPDAGHAPVVLGIATEIDQRGVDHAALRADVTTVLVLADVRTSLADHAAALDAAAASVDAAQVLLATYDVHAGPATAHPVPRVPQGWQGVDERVHATVGGAVAAALPAVVGARLLVVDAALDAEPEAWGRLLDALTPDTAVVQAVVRTRDDLVASAGAGLIRPGWPTWSVLEGFPVEDVGEAGTVVFAADEPVLAVHTSAVGIPPRTIDAQVTLAAWTRAAADVHGGAVRAVPVGRVYRDARETPRRLDTDAEAVVRGWDDRADAWTPTTLAARGLAIARVDAGPAGRPVALRVPVPWLVRAVHATDRAVRLRWSLKIAAHAGPRGDDWGDLFFAQDLAAALRRAGQEVVVDARDRHVRPRSEHLDDVSLVLRGLDDTPVVPGAVNVLWVISHPDLVTDPELARFDLRFAAGARWADATAARTGLPVRTLLQATDPARFAPGPSDPELASDVLFVGKTRDTVRPVVADAVAAGLDLTVWGSGWDATPVAPLVRGAFLPNDRLPDAYRSARVVLNDHWPDMADGGFLSNRLFDAAATGAIVVSDDVPGIREVAGPSVVVTAGGPDDLRRVVAAAQPGDEMIRSARAAVFAEHHSFDRRAAVLIEEVLRVRS